MLRLILLVTLQTQQVEARSASPPPPPPAGGGGDGNHLVLLAHGGEFQSGRPDGAVNRKKGQKKLEASAALINVAQLTIRCFFFSFFLFYSVYVCETPAGKGQQECQAVVGREQCVTLMSLPRGEVDQMKIPHRQVKIQQRYIYIYLPLYLWLLTLIHRNIHLYLNRRVSPLLLRSRNIVFT